MLINLTDVFTSEGKVKKIGTAFQKEFFSCMGMAKRMNRQRMRCIQVFILKYRIRKFWI